MVWLCPMWHFFHVATIWKSSLRDSIYNLLTYTNHSPPHQTKNQRIIRPKTKEPKQTTPPPCTTWAAQPSNATWSRNPASWGASKLRWALSPQILSLFDLMSFGVFIFLIRILGGYWGVESRFLVVVGVDLVGLMLRFVGCIWDFGCLRKESGRRTGSRSPHTWKYLYYKVPTQTQSEHENRPSKTRFIV